MYALADHVYRGLCESGRRDSSGNEVDAHLAGDSGGTPAQAGACADSHSMRKRLAFPASLSRTAKVIELEPGRSRPNGRSCPNATQVVAYVGALGRPPLEEGRQGVNHNR